MIEGVSFLQVQWSLLCINSELFLQPAHLSPIQSDLGEPVITYFFFFLGNHECTQKVTDQHVHRTSTVLFARTFKIFLKMPTHYKMIVDVRRPSKKQNKKNFIQKCHIVPIVRNEERVPDIEGPDVGVVCTPFHMHVYISSSFFTVMGNN